MTVMSLSFTVPELRLAAALLAPAGAIGLILVAIARSMAPEARSGGTIQGMLGGAVCLGSIVGAALAAWGFWSLWQTGGTWLTVSAFLAATGFLCGLGCGIIGIAGAVFARPLVIPVLVIGLAAAAIGLALAIVAGYGMADALAGQDPGARFVLVQALRLVASVYALAGLMGVGLMELMTAAPSRVK
jgi:hypothetical protein